MPNPFLLLLTAYPGGEPLERHLRVAGASILGVPETVARLAGSADVLKERFFVEYTGEILPARGSLSLDEARHLQFLAGCLVEASGQIVESLECAHAEAARRSQEWPAGNL